jgi:hypothetical protein
VIIRVRYTTGTYDYVSHAFLDDLIQGNKITKFLRSNGWATIGIDPIRTENMARAYAGPERRGEQRTVSFGLGLAKPILKKGLYGLLLCFALIASTLFGTALSAMFCPPVTDLEDPYSDAEIAAYTNGAIR